MTSRRHHPDWLQAFVATFEGRTEAPRRFLFWTGVATIAGALTRQVWIDETIFRYYPNNYIVFVAAPGQLTKSTTLSLGINLLKELEHIHLAADNTTFPAFIAKMSQHSREIRESVGDDPRDDVWVNQCAVTAAVSELGTFFKPEDEDMVNGLTDLYDCRQLLIKDTKNNGTDVIENPFFNLVACTTPKWVQDKLKAQIGGWGLSSRMIFVHASERERLIPRPSKLWSPGEYDRLTRALVSDLCHIAGLEGSFNFHPEADEWWSQWYGGHSERTSLHNSKPDSDPWVGHFLARKAGHVQKLAMVLSAARRDTLTIVVDDLSDAVRWIDEVEEELPKVFALGLETTASARIEQGVLKRLFSNLEGAKHLPRLALFNQAHIYVDSTTANRIIDNAINRGALKQLVSGGVAYLRLPGSESDAE